MNKLIEYVEKYKKESPTGWRKWVFGSLAVLALIILIAVYAVHSAMRGKELARLKHQADMANVAADEAITQASVKAHTEESSKHAQDAILAIKRAQEAARVLKALQKTHEEETAIITGLRSWEDVDAKVR